MDTLIDVNTGEVKVDKRHVSLRSQAIGSCIVIAAYDAKVKIGGMAHIMLPGRAPENTVVKTKYAYDAIIEMIRQMTDIGAEPENLRACLIGAGNVLQKKDDRICGPNIESVTQILKDRNIPVCASVVGGTSRKNAFLKIATGTVSCTEGDGPETVLWNAF